MTNIPESTVEDILELLRDAMFHIRRLPGRICRRARLVLDWARFGWSDCDYDHAFLFIAIRYKIARMRKSHERNRFTKDWREMVDQMESAEVVLDRIIADDYRAKAIGKLPKKGKKRGGPPVNHNHFVTMRMEDELRQEDVRKLGDILAEHSFGWWW